MLAKRIIPCLDVHGGRVVKGVNFVNLVDAGDPVEHAQVYDAEGADELILLDISATHEGRDTMLTFRRRRRDLHPVQRRRRARKIEDIRDRCSPERDHRINSAAVLCPT